MTATIVQFWKWKREKFSTRIDEFCKLIFEAADAGAEYWTKAKAPNASAELKEMQLAETKLDGFQRKIELFRLLIQSSVKLPDRDKLLDLLAEFFDSLTGANFGAKVRASDAARARLVFATGADVVAHLRSISPAPSFGLSVLAFIVLATIAAIAATVFHQ